jgi:hypothetical protein
MPLTTSINVGAPLDSNRSLSLSKLPLLQRMASNDNNGKRKLEEEAESSMATKRLRLSDNDGGDNDSFDSIEEETEEEEVVEAELEMEEEVTSEETLMNQLDTSEEKLLPSVLTACSSAMTVTPPRCHRSHAPTKDNGAPTRRAVMTTMMTMMTSGCR